MVATKVIWVVVAVQMVVKVVLMTVRKGYGSRGGGDCTDGDGHGKCW